MAQQPNHIHANQAEWQVAASYPEDLRKVVRWKTLIGGGSGRDPLACVPQKDVSMGVLGLDAGGFYPAHAHPAPEIYFIVSGSTEWTLDEETSTATPGMAIYHAPHMSHRTVNHSTEKLSTVWFLWAPGGRKDVLDGEIALLEKAPQRPATRPDAA